MEDDPRPLEPLVGNLWIPVWAVRPGSYSALRGLEDAMGLWLLLHSRNGDYWKPAYASRESLGVTLGVSRATISRRIQSLQKAHLLFERERYQDRKTKKHRPPARWALDPLAVDLWRPELEKALLRVAEDDGHDGRWVQRAMTSLDAFERRSRALAARIQEDMPFDPRPRRRKGKKRKKNPEKSDPRLKLSRGLKMSHEGGFFTREGGEEADPSRNGPEPKKKGVDAAGGERDSTPHQQGSEKMGPKSAVAQTRDPTESLAAQGASAGHDSK